MHRWHSFNDAIVLESLGIHDHPRPVKDYTDPEANPTTTIPHPPGWSNCATTPSLTSPKQRITTHVAEDIRAEGQISKLTSDGIYSISSTNPSKPFFTDDSDVIDVKEDSTIRAGVYALTMGIVGCLPDNVQRAMKSFSIKPEKQHITFSFPFMTNIIRQTAQLSTTHHQSHGLHHMTPMLLCDHSLNLIDGFDVVITLTADIQRCCVCVVHMTIYKSDSKEGVKQHYASLLKIILESLPQICLLPITSNCRGGTFVMLSDDCDPDEIATPLAETLMSARAADFLATGANPNEVILGLKENVILPCIISRPYAFRLAVTDVTSKLPDQDSERFVALAQYLLSDKCSEPELKKTDLLLKDPAFVPTVVRQFWALWGHELIAPKIFPIAKTLWDSDIIEDETAEQDHATVEGIQKWQTIFKLKCSSQRLSFREILQRLVQTLKAQGPIEEDPEDSKRQTNPLSSHHPRGIIPDGLCHQLPRGNSAAKTSQLFLNNNIILPEEGFERPRLNLASSTESIMRSSVEQGSSSDDGFEFTRFSSAFNESAPLPPDMDNERQYPCSLFCASPSVTQNIRHPSHHPFPFLPSSHGPLLPSRMPPALHSHVRHNDPLLMVAPPRRSDYFSRVFPPPRTPPYFHTQKLLSLADDRSRMRELRVRTNHAGPNIGLMRQPLDSGLFST
ncbi:uncharacterized protein [Amphiura filiformis]|uniref:uncharacterized protein n=1 Tax=Amphiura filiformis TaxID=82378 RepID=UPI003B22818B